MALSVDKKLFGTDDMEKAMPVVDDNCLIFDGTDYQICVVTDLCNTTHTYRAINENTGITYQNMHVCRYRPIML